LIALITGAGGQLGEALRKAAPTGMSVQAATRAELDIEDAAAVKSALQRTQATVVINAAAFTRVDDAETQREAAIRANVHGPAALARACRDSGAWLVHVSTDYVFDGGQNYPYAASAPAHPLSVYGRTKLDGELAVSQELGGRSAVVRTSWLYSAGHRNFLTTMLRRMADAKELGVVSDQIGAPTAASGFARVLWALSQRRASGCYHWCDSGVASWFDFAVAIAEESLALGILPSAARVVPIAAADYKVAAARPRFSLLDKRDTEHLLGVRAPHWRVALRETLGKLAAQRPRGEAR
jgi:dTDP-4-dehydrorhamnose reductase